LKKSSKIFDNDEDISSYSAFILLSPCQESHYTDAIKLSNKYNNIPIIALNSPYSYRYDIGMIIINNIIINVLIIITIISANVYHHHHHSTHSNNYTNLNHHLHIFIQVVVSHLN